MNNVLIAFIFTIIAGLSTIIGGLIILWSKKFCQKYLALALGFSAGIMVYLSFFELLKESFNLALSYWMTILMFLLGLLIGAIIDYITHKVTGSEHLSGCRRDNNIFSSKQKALYKVGLITAIALALHNFPEGIATFITTSFDVRLGLSIAIAIAIHNIPEGLCVAMPIYYSTQSRTKAILFTVVAALAEPLGALITYLFLRSLITDHILGNIYGAVAGIMVYVALDELLPTARRFQQRHLGLIGMIIGMIVMAISLYLLK